MSGPPGRKFTGAIEFVHSKKLAGLGVTRHRSIASSRNSAALLMKVMISESRSQSYGLPVRSSMKPMHSRNCATMKSTDSRNSGPCMYPELDRLPQIQGMEMLKIGTRLPKLRYNMSSHCCPVEQN